MALAIPEQTMGRAPSLSVPRKAQALFDVAVDAIVGNGDRSCFGPIGGWMVTPWLK